MYRYVQKVVARIIYTKIQNLKSYRLQQTSIPKQHGIIVRFGACDASLSRHSYSEPRRSLGFHPSYHPSDGHRVVTIGCFVRSSHPKYTTWIQRDSISCAYRIFYFDETTVAGHTRTVCVGQDKRVECVSSLPCNNPSCEPIGVAIATKADG